LPIDIAQGHRRLAELARLTAPTWQQIELLLVPTTPTIFRIDHIAADPLGRNASLGHHTSFVNLLGLSAIALPNGFLPSGLPAGVTLVAPASHEALLIAIGAGFERRAMLPLGVTASTIAS